MQSSTLDSIHTDTAPLILINKLNGSAVSVNKLCMVNIQNQGRSQDLVVGGGSRIFFSDLEIWLGEFGGMLPVTFF